MADSNRWEKFELAASHYADNFQFITLFKKGGSGFCLSKSQSISLHYYTARLKTQRFYKLRQRCAWLDGKGFAVGNYLHGGLTLWREFQVRAQ